MGKGRRNGWTREPVVCGRKFCKDCGVWRQACFFPRASKNTVSGEPILQARCDTCSRIYWNEMRKRRGARRRAQQREWYRIERRLQGIRPRYPDERGHRSRLDGKVHFPLEPYQPINHTAAAKREQVDATRFLEWYDDFNAEHVERRGTSFPGFVASQWSLDSHVVTVGDICELIGVRERSIRRARETGRIAYGVAEAFLTVAGHPEPWRLLDEEAVYADR